MKVQTVESLLREGRYGVVDAPAYGQGDPSVECGVINVFDDVQYQEILGFGAAFTESAAYNYSLLTAEQKQDFLERCFNKESGLGYCLGRVHINSCDFSLNIYNYVQEGDDTLETFDISRERQYVIPFLRDIQAYCQEPLVLMAAPWSPPAYMKDNNSEIAGGRLKEEYRRLWATYYAKYIEAFREEGIAISAISVQNEPNAVQTWESCFYSAEDERDFLEQHLIPVLDERGLSDIRIIVWDHNKERVYDRAKTILYTPEMSERVWAVGHHWYSGDHFDGLRLVQEQLNKPNICTEFCGGIEDDVVALAERYAREMCENLNNYMIASCDWNIMLDQEGGPFHNRTAQMVTQDGKVLEYKCNGCYAPVIYDRPNETLVYTPIYYCTGHFSRYIQKGARRIAVTKFSDDLHVCAVRNPDGSVVAIVLNATDANSNFHLRYHGECTPLTVHAHSVLTVVLTA